MNISKNEYDAIYNQIVSTVEYNKSNRKEVLFLLEKTVENIKNFCSAIENRDKNLLDYLKLLQDFSYSDIIESPTDLFPGIKTAKDMSDPEKLKAKVDTMKNSAQKVKEFHDSESRIYDESIMNLRNVFKALGQYGIVESQIYDLSMDLLNKSKSDYDVGQLNNY